MNKELQTKIIKVKEHKAELQQFDQNALSQEVEVGIKHVEKAQAFGKEVDKLSSLKSMCEKRLCSRSRCTIK